ncbi:DUF2207 domain-containing protein [Fusobacterium sp.]|uniref:DUF2207 domain-containing protein n=1 Tax=Fusobacterium sp. TaxID=68766 RepID=UPI00396C65EF
MKKIALIFVLLWSVVLGHPAYKIENLDIIALIQKDGSINIEEKVLYDIGDINGIFYNIDALGYGKLENLEIFYEEERGKGFERATESNYSDRGTYTIGESGGLYKIKLYAPARNEEKEFIFKYTLTKGITVYRDIAQLNRKMVGKDWGVGIKHIKLTVVLPEAVPKKDIYAFGHGPLTGNIDIENGKKIVYTLDNYRPGEFLEVNLLFPKKIISKFNPFMVKNERALNRILATEKRLAEEANERRQGAIMRVFTGRIVFVAGVIWWIFLVILIYIKNSKRHKVENPYGEYFRDLPDDYSPAVAGTLVSRKMYPESQELFASLLDLIRKKELILEQKDGKTILKISDERDKNLKDYEKFLLDWYIKELGDGTQVVLEDIDKNINTRSRAREFNSNYERWQTMVYTAMLSKNLRNDKRDKFSTVLGMVTGLGFFMGGMPLSAYFNTPIFVVLVILGFLLLPYTLSRKRFSLEKEKAYARWKAFKKFLVDYSNLEEAKLASIQVWEHYFVYAVALGVADKVAKGYKKIMSQKGEALDPGLITAGGTSLMGMYMYGNMFNVIHESTERAVRRSLESIAKSNASSTMGSGGGFSGGSSGGGGGRGGGGAF